MIDAPSIMPYHEPWAVKLSPGRTEAAGRHFRLAKLWWHFQPSPVTANRNDARGIAGGENGWFKPVHVNGIGSRRAADIGRCSQSYNPLHALKDLLGKNGDARGKAESRYLSRRVLQDERPASKAIGVVATRGEAAMEGAQECPRFTYPLNHSA